MRLWSGRSYDMKVKDILYAGDVSGSLNPNLVVEFEGAEVFGSQKRLAEVCCEYRTDLLLVVLMTCSCIEDLIC